MLKACLLLIMLSFAGTTHASENCGATKDHVDYRECLEKYVAQGRVELGDARTRLIKRIKTWDGDPEYRQRTLALLEQSFARFETFRDSQCEYEASLAAGGNGAGDVRLHCQIDWNMRYAKSLSDQLNPSTTP